MCKPSKKTTEKSNTTRNHHQKFETLETEQQLQNIVNMISQTRDRKYVIERINETFKNEIQLGNVTTTQTQDDMEIDDDKKNTRSLKRKAEQISGGTPKENKKTNTQKEIKETTTPNNQRDTPPNQINQPIFATHPQHNTQITNPQLINPTFTNYLGYGMTMWPNTPINYPVNPQWNPNWNQPNPMMNQYATPTPCQIPNTNMNLNTQQMQLLQQLFNQNETNRHMHQENTRQQ